jgi:hypothetical protein
MREAVSIYKETMVLSLSSDQAVLGGSEDTYPMPIVWWCVVRTKDGVGWVTRQEGLRMEGVEET